VLVKTYYQEIRSRLVARYVTILDYNERICIVMLLLFTKIWKRLNWFFDYHF